MMELFARYGDTYRVYAPGRKIVHVRGQPPGRRQARRWSRTTSNYTKGVGLDRVKILLGNGIMTSEGDFWKRQRYMMQPMFHRRVLTEFNRLIDDCTERFIHKREAQAARGERVNVTEDMSELTLDIVLRSIFGPDFDRLSQQAGGNPFDVVTKEQARDLQVRLQVSASSAR